MDDTIKQIITWGLSGGALGSAIGWFTARRKRRNDFLSDMQKSIDLLSNKYNEQLEENVKLSSLVVSLKNEITSVRAENKKLLEGQDELRRENAALSLEISSLREQLAGVKTITKTIKHV